MGYFEDIRGVFYVFLLFITSYLGSIYILFVFFPLILLAPRYWRKTVDAFVGYWCSLPVVLNEYLYGVRIHVTGDTIDGDYPALMIMNHRTRLDWLFLWTALYKIDPWLLRSEKISLKRSLRNIPGAGWAMECANFLFLRREWEHDHEHIADTIEYLAQEGSNYQVLLFPEGTDMTERTKEISDKYAQTHNLPSYEYVIHPRTTGFEFIVKRMRSVKKFDYVYDITIGYGDRIVQGELDFIFGQCPRQVFYHVQAYSNADIPQDSQGLKDWCNQRWAEKEKVLQKFYEDEAGNRNLLRSVSAVRGRQRTTQREFPVESRGMHLIGQIMSLAFWICTPSIWIYFFFYLTTFRWYFFIASASFFIIQRVFGGMDKLVLRCWKTFRRVKTQ